MDGLGESKEEALVVVVPSSSENASDMTSQLAFAKYLERGGISRPDDQVLATIAKKYSRQLQAVLSIGRTEFCTDLYKSVKELPSSFALGVIQSVMKISMNRPMSLEQPNILVAVDLKSGKDLFIKLLRIPQTTTSQSKLSKDDVSAEINACTMLSEANILGLVKCDVVEVTVRHDVWAAIKMKRYMSPLDDIPQLSEECLYRGFSRIFKALKAMHDLNMVHMDVKSDNVFVDAWDLGDFGSTRKTGAPVGSYTKLWHYYDIPPIATAIPAMDYVLLCVMVANKMECLWEHLCGYHENVQEHLIIKRLNSIEDINFKKEVVELFKQNMKIVRKRYCF